METRSSSSLPEGTRELTVPDDFRFNVDGKMLSVQELRAGMAGTATITTKTTVTPVTVTEVKNGTVMQTSGTSIIVRTDDGHEDVLAERHRQARCQDHARWQACGDLGLPCQRQADGHHRHDQAATGHDREGSAARRLPRAVAGGRHARGRCGAGALDRHNRHQRRLEPAATSGAAPRKLPKTASPLPFLALTGFASLLAALALTVRRHRATS